jgi:hypothetical protein
LLIAAIPDQEDIFHDRGLRGAHAGGVGGLHDQIGAIGDLDAGGLSPRRD